MSQVQATPSTRADRRVPVQLPVQIEGQNANGTPFCEMAMTVDVSRNGARLAPLQATVPLNAVLDVQYGAQKAPCRVIWLGKTPEERGQIGIRCLDESLVPWSQMLSANPISAAPELAQEGKTMEKDSAGKIWPSQERRRAPRYSCNIEAIIHSVQDSFTASARLTDISRNGGYLETMSPLPVGTEIKLTLETGRAKISVTGIVRTQHPTMGNGVAFTKIDVGAMQLLEAFLASLESPSQHSAEAANGTGIQEQGMTKNGSGDCLSLDPQIEALVELLEQKSILNREELLLHLQRKYS
jgi:PilZ domain